MSQSKNPRERKLRTNSGRTDVNIPPQLATELDLEKGQKVAVHDGDDHDGITYYTDPTDAPTYAFIRKVQYTDEYLVNVPARIINGRGLDHDQNVEWGEPDAGVVELTPTEATA